MTDNKELYTNNEILPFITCPITHEIFKSPVFAKDGYIYEKKQIKEWFKINPVSPITNELISHKVIPAYFIKSLIDTYYVKNKIVKHSFENDDGDADIDIDSNNDIIIDNIKNKNKVRHAINKKIIKKPIKKPITMSLSDPLPRQHQRIVPNTKRAHRCSHKVHNKNSDE